MKLRYILLLVCGTSHFIDISREQSYNNTLFVWEISCTVAIEKNNKEQSNLNAFLTLFC